MFTFVSSLPHYTTFIRIVDITKKISFTRAGYGQYTYGLFRTADPVLAEALKKHPAYGSIFKLEESDEQQPKEEKQYVAVYPKVEKAQEANKILREQYNYPADKLKSKSAALQAAEELNISFPNLR